MVENYMLTKVTLERTREEHLKNQQKGFETNEKADNFCRRWGNTMVRTCGCGVSQICGIGEDGLHHIQRTQGSRELLLSVWICASTCLTCLGIFLWDDLLGLFQRYNHFLN